MPVTVDNLNKVSKHTEQTLMPSSATRTEGKNKTSLEKGGGGDENPVSQNRERKCHIPLPLSPSHTFSYAGLYIIYYLTKWRSTWPRDI